jgi:hypothetical protein
MPSLPTRVPGVVRGLARWAVMSSIGVAGCAGGEPEDEHPGVPWTELGCPSNKRTLFESLAIEPRPGYVGIYEEVPFPAPSIVEREDAFVREERGTPCRDAMDMDACLAEFDAAIAISTDCKDRGECDTFLLTTYGDEVTRTTDRSALVELIGPIEHPSAALLLARFDGYWFACPGESIDGSHALRGTATRDVGDSIEIRIEGEECGDGLYRTLLRVERDGTLTEVDKKKLAPSNCVVGRRPVGLCTAPAAARGGAGPYLADAARLEAASVHAFARLARELAVLGAGPTLVGAAVRAAHDEVRHAARMTGLAQRWGVEPTAPVVAELPLRGALAVALDNAVEGCVRETYGALVAHHQAQTALDPELRAALSEIAVDETRHATLSWQVASFLEPRLSPDERALVARARRAAVHQLLAEVEHGPRGAMARILGLPEPTVAARAVRSLNAALGLGG